MYRLTRLCSQGQRSTIKNDLISGSTALNSVALATSYHAVSKVLTPYYRTLFYENVKSAIKRSCLSIGTQESWAECIDFACFFLCSTVSSEAFAISSITAHEMIVRSRVQLLDGTLLQGTICLSRLLLRLPYRAGSLGN